MMAHADFGAFESNMGLGEAQMNRILGPDTRQSGHVCPICGQYHLDWVSITSTMNVTISTRPLRADDV